VRIAVQLAVGDGPGAVDREEDEEENAEREQYETSLDSVPVSGVIGAQCRRVQSRMLVPPSLDRQLNGAPRWARTPSTARA
jgi:hypothetical protein